MSYYKNIQRRKLALEDDTLNPGEDGPGGGASTVPVDQVAEDILELNEAEGEVNDAEGDVEEAEEGLASLESIAFVMEDTLANGGMTKSEARFAGITVQAVTTRLGMDNRTASFESFTGSGARLSNTRLSLEGVKETMQSVIDAIIRFLESMRAKLKDFFQKIFGAAKSLRKRAEAIEASARSTAGAPKEAKIELGVAIAEKLAIGGEIPSDIPGSLKAYVSLGNALYTGYAESASKSATAIADFVSHVDASSDEKFEATAGSAQLDKIPLPKAAGLKTAKDASSDSRFSGMPVKVTSSQELLGGKALFVQNPAEGAAGDTIANAVKNRFGAFKIFIDRFDAKREALKEKKSVTGLTQAQVMAATATVIEICDQIDGFEKSWSKREEVSDKLSKAGKSLKGKTSGADKLSSANQAGLRQVPSLLKVGESWVSGPTSSMSRELVQTSKAVLDYCQQSLSNLGA